MTNHPAYQIGNSTNAANDYYSKIMSRANEVEKLN